MPFISKKWTGLPACQLGRDGGSSSRQVYLGRSRQACSTAAAPALTQTAPALTPHASHTRPTAPMPWPCSCSNVASRELAALASPEAVQGEMWQALQQCQQELCAWREEDEAAGAQGGTSGSGQSWGQGAAERWPPCVLTNPCGQQSGDSMEAAQAWRERVHACCARSRVAIFPALVKLVVRVTAVQRTHSSS